MVREPVQAVPAAIAERLGKMRVRRTPANQAHVTNRKEHPALLAADAAEAALRGFAEIETTVGVARYAPLNLSIGEPKHATPTLVRDARCG